MIVAHISVTQSFKAVFLYEINSEGDLSYDNLSALWTHLWLGIIAREIEFLRAYRKKVNLIRMLLEKGFYQYALDDELSN